CRVCRQEKPPAAYSKTQLQKWYNQKRNDRYNEVTPETVGLSCKDHGTNERVIRCHGPCDRIKMVDYFSKRQRNDPEPWCIDCTEWRLDFDGNEVPTAAPGGSLVYHHDSIEDDHQSESSAFPSYGQHKDEDENDDENEDSDDEPGGPCEDPTLISGLVDRLQGYGGLAEASEGTTPDAMSATNSVKISLWDEGANDGRTNSVSGKSAGASTGVQRWGMQNLGTFIDGPTTSDSGRIGSRLQGYSPAASSAPIPSMAPTATGVPPHLRRLVDGTNQARNVRASQSAGPGEGSQSSSSRFTAGRPPPERMSGKETTMNAFGLVSKSSGANQSDSQKPSMKSRGSGKGTGDKWYKGDNRKVFPGKKTYVPDANQDRREDPHDSDSPDEM
ncbi:hypothetical protein F5Y10DRAFT_284057, partial [Nemania abortiva]